jgi:hypothetical protein
LDILSLLASAAADVRYIVNHVNLIKENTQVNPVRDMFLNRLILKILFWWKISLISGSDQQRSPSEGKLKRYDNRREICPKRMAFHSKISRSFSYEAKCITLLYFLK